MKICQLIDFTNIGGAGIAATRIGNAVKKVYDYNFTEISSNCSTLTEKTIPLQNSRKVQILNVLSSFIDNDLLKRYKNRDLNRQLKKILCSENPDVINIHNLHSSDWPISLVKTCLKHSPVLWTLHDCWSFLGTYYPSHSPAPCKNLTRDLKNFWRQNRSHLYAVTPSHWLKGQATKFSWDKTKITTIKNPIPDTFFEKKNRSACKEALGIKDDLPAVICIAGNLEEERKGGLFLKQILNTSIVEKVQFLLIGSGFNDCHDNIRSLGFIKDELTLKIAYHAADLLLHPAPIDNLPNTVAESISCGTPVLAFETGGIPEMVVEDVSGWLVKSIDTDSMIKKLKTIIESSLYINIRNSCQQFAEDHFNYNEIGSLYIKLFESLHLKSHSTPR